jgi:hypothetical protein
MTNILRSLLVGACIVLGAVIVSEWIVAVPGFYADHSPIDAQAPHIDNRTAAKAGRLVGEILKRPLFTPGREPPQVHAPKPEPPHLEARLAGVSLRPNAKEAMFMRPGGKAVSVMVGQVIDGWTVSDIATDRVVLTCSFGEQIVHPAPGAPGDIPVRPVIKKKTLPINARPIAAARKTPLSPSQSIPQIARELDYPDP